MTPDVVDALQLRDIHLPGAPEFWPPAWGWWLLMAAVLALLLVLLMTQWRRLMRKRRLDRLLGLLKQLQRRSDLSETERLAELSGLLRRVALMHHPRRDIASLTGSDWLRFLDASGGQGGFTNGPGRVLGVGPYTRHLAESVDWSALNGLARDWVMIQVEGRDAA